MGKKIFIIFGIFITIFMISSAIIDMNRRSKSVETYKFETVARVYKFSSNRSFNIYYYEYFFKGKKYWNNEDIGHGNRDGSVDKYYKMNLSTQNPDYSKIILENEITESSQIKAAGF
jgi:hypothetical protein